MSQYKNKSAIASVHLLTPESVKANKVLIDMVNSRDLICNMVSLSHLKFQYPINWGEWLVIHKDGEISTLSNDLGKVIFLTLKETNTPDVDSIVTQISQLNDSDFREVMSRIK